MKFTRRTFLQGASLSLASLSGFFHNVIVTTNPFNQYGATLAQSTPRKLALLIGINQYSQGSPLRGCLTDVELQQELLIHRFQFLPTDIVTITDKQATREGILTAFDEHLTKQVKENDVVVVHFSGYGRQVQLQSENAIGEAAPSVNANSLITYDSIFPTQKSQPVDDILLDTLISLCQSLKTNKYTLVLDTSYQPIETPICNKLSLRSYSAQNQELSIISEQELNFNQQFKKQFKNIQISQPNYSQLSGLILSTANHNIATEVTSHNFNVGLFTYYLTQSLWQGFPQSNNLTVMENVNSQIALYTFDGEKVNFVPETKTDISPYYLPLPENTRGDAIITKLIPPNNVELELLGLPLLFLSNCHLNSYLTAELATGEIITVQINSITGNKAKGIIINFDKKITFEGLILRENLRVINKHIGLTIALDKSLEKIEKVDATSALTAMENIKSVVNITENFADCILGKFSNDSNGSDSYGLFSVAGTLLPNTTAKKPLEAVSTAVKRLSAPLENILTEKLLHLTLNQNSSLLAVNINLEINHDNKIFTTQKKTVNSNINKAEVKTSKSVNNHQSLFMNVPFGSQFTLTINNENYYDLYCLLLAVNSARQIVSYFSPNTSVLTGGETMTIPTKSSPLKWIVNSNKGMGELIVICAKSPFNKTLNALYKTTNLKAEKEQIIILENPVIIANSILEDLHIGNNNNLASNLNLSEVYTLDLANWAGFNFVYEIV